MNPSPLPATELFVPSDETRTDFSEHFNRSPFPVRHRLDEHPLFSTDSLVDLACRMAAVQRDSVYYDTGAIEVQQKWSSIPVRTSFRQALDRLASGDSWIILKSAHQDAAYGPVLDQLIAEIAGLTRLNAEKEIESRIMSVILSSPRRVTPYHMDGETNFLLQIRGSKTIYVFDGSDRSVVSEAELKQYWTGDRNAATYKESTQASATPFDLKPGVGVHVPLLFPHWVKNGQDVSVSVSINFVLRSSREARDHPAVALPPVIESQPYSPEKSSLLGGVKFALSRAFGKRPEQAAKGKE